MKQELTNIFKDDPFAKMIGMELLEWDEGYAKVTMKVTEDMLNFHGAANGGVVFALTDYAFAVASNSHGKIAVGINTHMSFMAACNVGDQLYCTGTEVDKNHRLAVYKMEVRTTSGDLIATMDGMVYRKKNTFPND